MGASSNPLGERENAMQFTPYPKDRALTFLSEKVGAAIMQAERHGLSESEIVDAVMGEMVIRPEYGAAINAWLADAAKDEGMQGLEIPATGNAARIAQINAEFANDIAQAYAGHSRDDHKPTWLPRQIGNALQERQDSMAEID
jgi:hypothetical protein